MRVYVTWLNVVISHCSKSKIYIIDCWYFFFFPLFFQGWSEHVKLSKKFHVLGFYVNINKKNIKKRIRTKNCLFIFRLSFFYNIDIVYLKKKIKIFSTKTETFTKEIILFCLSSCRIFFILYLNFQQTCWLNYIIGIFCGVVPTKSKSYQSH